MNNGTFKRAWRAVDTVFEVLCILCLVARFCSWSCGRCSAVRC